MALANNVILWLMLSGIGSLVAWSALRRRGLVWLAVVNTVASFVISNVVMPSGTDIRVDLLLTVPLLFVVLIRAAVERLRQRAPTKKE
jgi:hypothetical protein